MRIHQGFTLIELMITLVIFSILAAITFPSFDRSIQNNRLTSQTNRLLAAFQFARSEAAANGSELVVCSSSDGSTCDTSKWANGFIILDEKNVVLHTFDGLKGGNRLLGSSKITFDSKGTLAAQVQLSLCDKRGKDYAKGIFINGAGQIRTGGDVTCGP